VPVPAEFIRETEQIVIRIRASPEQYKYTLNYPVPGANVIRQDRKIARAWR
jgi:hypothetical protein